MAYPVGMRRPLIRLHNPRTGIAIYPLRPGDKGYGPDSRAFAKAVMESLPRDDFDLGFRHKFDELAAKWETLQKRRDRNTPC